MTSSRSGRSRAEAQAAPFYVRPTLWQQFKGHWVWHVVGIVVLAIATLILLSDGVQIIKALAGA